MVCMLPQREKRDKKDTSLDLLEKGRSPARNPFGLHVCFLLKGLTPSSTKKLFRVVRFGDGRLKTTS